VLITSITATRRASLYVEKASSCNCESSGIMNQFSLSCALHRVSKLAALVQAIITSAQPLLSQLA
jgi:hypothetical protein